jgi:alkanesulfonate monooxygenase SsuD/methylene tetrahydromethanopterin reductase-like flavin-dependent oxidoreductase (luciferase family)
MEKLRFSLWTDGRTTRGQPVTATTYQELAEEVVFAEQLGFDGVWSTEHPSNAFKGCKKRCLLPSCVSGRTHQEFHMMPS